MNLFKILVYLQKGDKGLFDVTITDGSCKQDRQTEDNNGATDNIIDIIARDERIADLQFDEKDNSIDMVYYIDQVLDRVESFVSNTAQSLGIDLEVEDIRSITDDLLDDDEFNDDMVRKIKSKDKDYEI